MSFKSAIQREARATMSEPSDLVRNRVVVAARRGASASDGGNGSGGQGATPTIFYTANGVMHFRVNQTNGDITFVARTDLVNLGSYQRSLTLDAVRQ